MLLLWFMPLRTNAQDEEAAVKKAIDQLFMGMKTADSAMVHEVFSDDVKMQTVVTSESGDVIPRTDIAEF